MDAAAVTHQELKLAAVVVVVTTAVAEVVVRLQVDQYRTVAVAVDLVITIQLASQLLK